MKPFLSVVIPSYNEAVRLKKTLPEIIAFFKKQKFSSEIIIVDDGSTDQTIKVTNTLIGRSKNIKLISHTKNSGKGAAIKTGVLASGGEWVLFMDADLSTPLIELNNFWPYTKGSKIVIGSRKMEGAKIQRHQSFLRENLGKIFTILTNSLATKGISDITCGFKLFKGSVARDLFKKSLLPDWSFDAEILYLAQKKNINIKEVPVVWKNDPRTKVNMLKDGTKAMLGLLKIRLNDFQGKY